MPVPAIKKSSVGLNLPAKASTKLINKIITLKALQPSTTRER